MARRPAKGKMDAAAKAEARATTAAPPPDPIDRAEEEGKINRDTDPGPEIEHNEDKSDVGDATAIAEAYDEGLITPRSDTPEDETRARLADESTDYVENGAVDAETQKKNSSRAKASLGQIVSYHSNVRRAGIRNSQARPAIVTHVDEDGSVSLTVFDVDGERRIRKVTNNRQADEHWRA